MSVLNVRLRGKISRDEWPAIVDRFRSGETLASIARSYRCTAPAIRYIVARADVPGAGTVPVNPPKSLEQDSRRSVSSAPRGLEQRRPPRGRASPLNPTGHDIWSRVNTDIATFLAAVDNLFMTDSDNNYEVLLQATDRLLWASARTRLELERILAERRGTGARRRALG